MQAILTIIQHSPYARAYKYMDNIEQEEVERVLQENIVPWQVSLDFKFDLDRKWLSELTHEEVFVGENGPAVRCISISMRQTTVMHLIHFRSLWSHVLTPAIHK